MIGRVKQALSIVLRVHLFKVNLQFLEYPKLTFRITLGITSCNLFARDFDINLLSTINKEIGRQFLANLLALSFFSISFVTACL